MLHKCKKNLMRKNQILQRFLEKYQEIKNSLCGILGVEEKPTSEEIESILEELEKEKEELKGV